MIENANNVVAVIVTFQPVLKVLERLLERLSSQVDSILVVDNGSNKDLSAWYKVSQTESVEILRLRENKGIAAAHNEGIQWALKHSVEFVLLMDQDSIPEVDMVENLLSALKNKNQTGTTVAAVGANYSDIKGSQISPFVKLTGCKLHRVSCPDNEIVAVDHLISSGCLISLNALNVVGPMEQKLFIDYVDTEWCLRAINKGYSLFGVGSAKMQHDLGDEFVNVFGRTITVRSPLRYYYLLRNGVWLLFQPWVPLNWKVMDFIRLLKIYLVLSLFTRTKFDNWKMMTKGIWHAVTCQMGKLN
jgi:rhamnosyltransferase